MFLLEQIITLGVDLPSLQTVLLSEVTRMDLQNDVYLPSIAHSIASQ